MQVFIIRLSSVAVFWLFKEECLCRNSMVTWTGVAGMGCSFPTENESTIWSFNHIYSKSLGSLSRAPLFALENDGFYGWTALNLRNDWSMVQFHNVWVAVSFRTIIRHILYSRFQTVQFLLNDPLSLAFSEGPIISISSFLFGQSKHKPGFTKPFGGENHHGNQSICTSAPPPQYHHP